MINSGSEVIKATRAVPTNPVPKPVVTAIDLLLDTRSGITKTNANVAMPNPIKARLKLGIFPISSGCGGGGVSVLFRIIDIPNK